MPELGQLWDWPDCARQKLQSVVARRRPHFAPTQSAKLNRFTGAGAAILRNCKAHAAFGLVVGPTGPCDTGNGYGQ